ncbi:hypothetical protein Scep_027711 [Stephania cephalantha]|uniref:Uncharacterized protein n=1 Tax=Stephania cephalantha TaxID=152367 RepID=A0AAP0EGW8_9MAGN
MDTRDLGGIVGCRVRISRRDRDVLKSRQSQVEDLKNIPIMRNNYDLIHVMFS